MKDDFRGDDASLISNATALLEMDAEGCLVPHGIGGHARGLLQAFIVRLQACGAAQASPPVPENRVPEAWTNLLAYVLQDDMHNRLTPRVVDIAYTAFMQARRPNEDDGGASDWFNDTKPKVAEMIKKLRKDLIEELAAPPAPSAQDVEDAANWRTLLDLPGARRRIWNHVLDDQQKANCESLIDVLAKARAQQKGGA